MSFSYDTKNELCQLPIQRTCCARAEAYGILLYCNTFHSAEVRIVTENPNFAARLPRLFHRSAELAIDKKQPLRGAFNQQCLMHSIHLGKIYEAQASKNDRNFLYLFLMTACGGTFVQIMDKFVYSCSLHARKVNKLSKIDKDISTFAW